MIGVGHSLQKVTMTKPATHVFRWASIGSLDAVRHLRTGNSRQRFFDLDTVMPTVTKVVEVIECPLSVQRLDQRLRASGFTVG